MLRCVVLASASAFKDVEFYYYYLEQRHTEGVLAGYNSV